MAEGFECFAAFVTTLGVCRASAKSQTSVLGLLDIYHPPEPLMAIFQAYFDESGKFKDKQIVSFCGLVSTVARIMEFEVEWKRLLRSYGMKDLSMKRALKHTIALGQNVAAKTAKERNNAFQPFADCIRRHFELGVAIVVDVAAYDKWPVHLKQKFAGGSPNPHYFSFINALVCCSKFMRDEDRMSLICDDDKETAMNCYGLYGRARFLNPDIKKSLVAITFAEDSEFVPLQGADFLASLCRLEARRRMHKEYYEYMPSFTRLTGKTEDSRMQWCVRFYDKERLDNLTRPPKPGALPDYLLDT